VATSENRFHDPEGDAIQRREIPTADPPKVSKGYWDSVIRRLKLLNNDQVLKLAFPPDTQVEGFRSSIHWAGARAGRRLSAVTRGSCVYIRDVEPRERKRYRRPRDTISCEACGGLIEHPRSRQVVHGGGKKKSVCQRARLYAKRHGAKVAVGAVSSRAGLCETRVDRD